MLYRLLFKRTPMVRMFTLRRVPCIEVPADYPDDIEAVTVRRVIDKSDIIFLDTDLIPKYTYSGYQEKMKKIYHEYCRSLHSITDGVNTVGIFQNIIVYAFSEHVQLPFVAKITQTSATSYKIVSHDQNNAPLIEVALKKSHYGFEVKRDFGEITATLKNPKTFGKDSRKGPLEATLKIHKERIEEVIRKAKERFVNNPQAIEHISALAKDVYLKMDKDHEVMSKH